MVRWFGMFVVFVGLLVCLPRAEGHWRTRGVYFAPPAAAFVRVAPAPVVVHSTFYRAPTVVYRHARHPRRVVVAPAPMVVAPRAVVVARPVVVAPVVTTRYRPIIGGTVTRGWYP